MFCKVKVSLFRETEQEDNNVGRQQVNKLWEGEKKHQILLANLIRGVCLREGGSRLNHRKACSLASPFR